MWQVGEMYHRIKGWAVPGRRVEDLNLCGLSPTRFRGVRHKPLGQPSLAAECAHQESDLDQRFRKPLFYPLNYGRKFYGDYTLN